MNKTISVLTDNEHPNESKCIACKMIGFIAEVNNKFSYIYIYKLILL